MSNNSNSNSSGSSNSPNNQQAGRGGRSGGRFSNRRTGRFNNRRNNNINTSNKNVFKGACEALQGHVIDSGKPGQLDKYTETMKQIANYVGSTYKNGGDIRKVIENVEEQTIPIPSDPPEGATVTMKAIWQEEIKLYMKRKQQLEENKKTAFSLIEGQCTPETIAKLESLPEWEDIKNNYQLIKFLETLQAIVYKFEGQKYAYLSMYQAKKRFYNVYQSDEMTTSEYLEKFKLYLAVIEQYGGSISLDPNLIGEELKVKGASLDTATDEQQEEAEKIVREKVLAIIFIMNANKTRFNTLKTTLENDYTKGNDQYPKDLVSAFHLLTYYKQDPSSYSKPSSRSEQGVSFAQKGKEDKSKNIKCYGCGAEGVKKPDCPKCNPDKKTNNTGKKFVTIGGTKNEVAHTSFQFLQPKEDVDPNWILLDNQSTTNVFCNKNLLSNIRVVNESMTIYSTGGCKTTNMKGDLGNIGEVWYMPDGIANVLSLKEVKKLYPITYDSREGDVFTVHTPEHKVHFKCSDEGLYYHDVDNRAITLVTTVEGNKEGYSERQIKQAELARKIYAMVGRPSPKDFMAMIKTGTLKNVPITAADVLAANKIFGPDVGSLKGKTVRKTPPPVVTTNMMAVPNYIMDIHKDVTLAGDIFFVNKVPYLMTISRNIKFMTIGLLKNRSTNNIFNQLKDVTDYYRTRGFNITTMLMDPEFERLRQKLLTIQVQLNCASKNEHVPDVERQIRVLKERVRATRHTLPFKNITNLMLHELINFCAMWINFVPPKGGVSKDLSPRTIMTGSYPNYNTHCRIPFGAYAQVHEENSPTNTTDLPRTTGAICLGPTGNVQGGYKFMSLVTGRKITRQNFTELPMPADAVKRVEALAEKEKASPTINFYTKDGNELIDKFDPADDDTIPTNNIHPDNLDIAGVDDVDDDDELNENPSEDEDDFDDAQIAGVHNIDTVVDNVETVDDLDNNDEDMANFIDDNNDVADQEEDDLLQHANDLNNMDNENPEEEITFENARNPGGKVLRNIPRVNYAKYFVTPSEVHYIMTTLSVKAGMKKWGDKAEHAVSKEFSQLHYKDTFEPVKGSSLTPEEKKKALESLTFLKEKRSGDIKGRTCVNGSKQRTIYQKEDAASPTVSVESVLLSCVIDAKEKRNVVTADIPGAYLNADMDETVHMVLRGKLAELMVETAPDVYGPYLETDEKGNKVLYVKLLKALYGHIRSAILWWKTLSEELTNQGFTLNPYDPCVANKIINDKQCTITWHVDDLKISHVENPVIDDILKKLGDKYGELTVTRGKVHDYLGMLIDYSAEGEVKIYMTNYVNDAIESFPEEITGESTSPAANHLFECDENAEKLDKEKAESFHTAVAKCLWICKRGRPDLNTAVSFLTTRVKAPDIHDYKKLIRLLKYLNGTREMPLTLSADDTNIIKWWADGSFAVHPNMRSHTGGTMTLGKGSIYSTSTKQKLNTKSSTEAELVAANDVLPQLLWTQYFLKEQGYEVNDSILYQDNQAAIILEKNGKASSSKRTRHINIRYFFIKDRQESGELSIKYCPTDQMIADYFTKPLQGSKFLQFRKLIMNLKD